jgi:hypothetical protein
MRQPRRPSAQRIVPVSASSPLRTTNSATLIAWTVVLLFSDLPDRGRQAGGNQVRLAVANGTLEPIGPGDPLHAPPR